MKNSTLRFGSVCSGIEAASVAWEPLGWKAAWFSEIEPFPSAVLAHHYPDVPNLGDMTSLPDRIRSGEIEAPDILCGGTPCQAFSVAGNRRSLDDARGNLSLTFCEIANAIDHARRAAGKQPAIIFWENVPGVLSTKDNAFGCFLGELAGEDSELKPPGGKWSNAGCVFGPKRAIAWRILDAQYFGVAQRRRRVFVVAGARDGFDPAEILFEFEGVRRDTAPSRGAGEEAAGTLTSSLGRRNEAPDCASTPGLIQPVPPEGCWWDGGQVSQTLDAVPAKGQTMPEKNRFPAVLQPAVPLQEIGKRTGSSTTDKRAGIGIGEDGDPMFTLQAGAQHGVAAYSTSGAGYWREGIGALRARPQDSHENIVAFSCKDYGADAGPISPTLRAMGHGQSHANAGGQVAVCVTGDITHTLRAEGFDASEDGTGRGQPIIAQSVALRGRDGGATAELGGPVAGTLRASSGGGDKPHVLAPVAFDTTQITHPKNRSNPQPGSPCHPLSATAHAPAVAFQTRDSNIDVGDIAGTIGTNADRASGSAPMAQYGMAVRRLTPVECERLQGFPDGYTMIPTNKRNWARELEEMRDYFRRTLQDVSDEDLIRLAADGPRYKALGNSWAVPNVRWIGRRIDAALKGAL